MTPYLCPLPTHRDARGSLSVLDALPFLPARIFVLHGGPDGAQRGGHAHRHQHQVLVCAAGGPVRVTVERRGRRQTFCLDAPTCAVYVPPLHWVDIDMGIAGSLFVLASGRYEETDYIRTRREFVEVSQ